MTKEPVPESSSSYLQIPTIPSDFIQQMVAHLQVSSCLSKETQCQLSLLLAKAKVSIAEYNDLFQRIAENLGDEMIGFLPKPVPLGSYETLCHLLYNSSDLYAAIENYNRFYSLFLNAGDSLLDLSEFRARQCISLNSVSEQSRQPMFQQTIIMALLKIPAWLAGQRIPLAHLAFDYEPMPFNEEFNYLFGVVPDFSAPRTMLRYAEGVLDIPVRPTQSAPQVGGSFITHILHWTSKDDLQRQIYAEISHRLPRGDFDVVRIAEAMNISKHTLARRLKACDSSYSRVLERVRRDKAFYLLLNSSSSVEEIAELLGFQELGSFSRAFKSWTDLSPSQYRERSRSSS